MKTNSQLPSLWDEGEFPTITSENDLVLEARKKKCWSAQEMNQLLEAQKTSVSKLSYRLGDGGFWKQLINRIHASG